MRCQLLLAGCLLWHSFAQAQAKTTLPATPSSKQQSSRPTAEIRPAQPVGGQAALAAHLQKTIAYPEAARQARASALVFVKLQLDSAGQVKSSELLAAMHHHEAPNIEPQTLQQAQQQLTEAATAALRTGIGWQPSRRHGRAIPGEVTVPIYFDAAPATVGLPAGLQLFPTEPAAFAGGPEAYMRFLGKNIRYPAAALRRRVQGKVLLMVEVDEAGRLGQPLVVQSVSPEIDAEAKRVLALLPPMLPALEQGQPVRSCLIVPVSFMIR